VISTIGAAVKIAALLIRMSIWPSAATVSATAASMLSCRVTSISTAMAASPISAAPCARARDVDVRDGDARAFAHVGLGKGAPDAAGRARDQGRFAASRIIDPQTLRVERCSLSSAA
jgi:hypothetical protein